MEQIELFTIESPCRSVCVMTKKGYCKGCLRNREERFHWFSFTNEERHRVLDLCKQRRARLLKAHQERLEADASKALPFGIEEDVTPDLFSK